MNLALQERVRNQQPSRWVTRERPKIDRIACPWLILRFIDPRAEFLFVPTEKVLATADSSHAIAFDIPGAPLTHSGPFCSFDAIVAAFAIADSGVLAMAPIIRGADTDRHELAPEAAGLHALSLGLSLNYADDHDLLRQGLILYDALHSWAAKAGGANHNWAP